MSKILSKILLKPLKELVFLSLNEAVAPAAIMKVNEANQPTTNQQIKFFYLIGLVGEGWFGEQLAGQPAATARAPVILANAAIIKVEAQAFFWSH